MPLRFYLTSFQVNIKSYANNNELAVMPQDRVVRLEWDRRYLSVLGVENNRLYELRLQTPESVFVDEENDLRQVMDSFRVNKVSDWFTEESSFRFLICECLWRDRGTIFHQKESYRAVVCWFIRRICHFEAREADYQIHRNGHLIEKKNCCSQELSQELEHEKCNSAKFP